MHCNLAFLLWHGGRGRGRELIWNVKTQPIGHGRGVDGMKLPGLTRCLISVESVVLGSGRP